MNKYHAKPRMNIVTSPKTPTFIILFICHCSSGLRTVESPKGVSPSGSHGTVLESLPSYGSSCLITKVSIPLWNCDTYGRTNFQWANKSGRFVYFICNHLIDAIL